MKAAIFISNLSDNAPEFVEKSSATLKKLGVQADTSYIETVRQSGDNFDLMSIYTSIRKILHKNDIIIIENTQHSTGMGMILGRVVELNKPVLILQEKDHSIGNRAILPRAHSAGSKKVKFSEYSDGSLEQVLSEFTNESKKLLNSKFLFNLSPEMASYLQWSSEHYNSTMVDILRDLINEKMENDEAWNNYLKDEQ
jgi:hypothetical protein